MTAPTASALPIAVSGATGNIGSRVARLVAAAGATQRLIVRDPERAPDLPGATIALVPEYGATDALTTALTGTPTVLMVSGRESADRLDQHRSFVEAAVAAGVEHLVYTSYFNAAPDAVFSHGRLHWATEQIIRDSGIAFTFLRDNLYADFLPFLAGPDGVIRGPAGDGRLAAVAQDDVAAVAAAVLLDPAPHAGRTYDLTGPQAHSLAEIAALLTGVLGREITYYDETLEEARASRAQYGAPDWEVDAWISTYTAIAAGEMAGVSGDVERILGRPPLGLAEVVAPVREPGSTS